jgi:hypothetical protein
VAWTPSPVVGAGFLRVGISVSTGSDTGREPVGLASARSDMGTYMYFAGGVVKLAGTSSRTYQLNNAFQPCSIAPFTYQSQDFLAIAYCNQSFVAVANLSDPSQFADARVWLLSGDADYASYKEGFRTEALYERELYVSGVPGTQNRILVLDTLNCVLRELVMHDYPGRYLVSSYLLYGIPRQCYGEGSLRYPRGPFSWWSPLLMSPLGDNPPGNRILFTDALLVYEFHWDLRVVKSTGISAIGVANVSYGSDVFSVLVRTKDIWLVYAGVQEPCPDGYTSTFGGVCNIPCVNGNYVSETGDCLPCVPLACGVGYEPVECSPRSAPSCAACLSLPSTRAYVVPGTCDLELAAFLPPCPDGYYEQGRSCKMCPRFSSGSPCTCWTGFLQLDYQCVGLDLYGVPWTQPEAYDWMPFLNPSEYECGDLEYLANFNGTKECQACPTGMIGFERRTCVFCPPLQEQVLKSSVCGCVPFATPMGDECVCVPGYEMAASVVPSQIGGVSRTVYECVQCPSGTYSDGSTPGCSLCGLGTYSSQVGATSCVACAVGQYADEVGLRGCLNCTSPGWARDPRSQASCVSCAAECAVGFYAATECHPPGFYDCVVCDALPSFAQRTQGCDYDCNVGYYRVEDGCMPCNASLCEAGTYR